MRQSTIHLSRQTACTFWLCDKHHRVAAALHSKQHRLRRTLIGSSMTTSTSHVIFRPLPSVSHIKRHKAMRPSLGSSPSQRKNSVSFIRSELQKQTSFATLSTSGQEQGRATDVEEGANIVVDEQGSNGNAAELETLLSPSKSKSAEKAADAAGTMLQGQLCLMGVAILWGSYSPALRYIFSLSGPPRAEALTAVRAVMQGVLLLAFSLLFSGSFWGQSSKPSQDAVEGGKKVIPKAVRHDSGAVADASQLGRWLSGGTDSLALAGAELGLWNFLASSFQALGLEITSATRASFLIQVTALLTPALATAAGERPGRSVWLGCGVALAGTLLLSLDKAAPVLEPANAVHFALGGDACIFAAAFFYSLATVRLSRLASGLPSLQLATAKSAAFAIIATAWLSLNAANQIVSHEPLTGLWEGYRDPAAWLVLVWSAVGPGALAAFLQTQGQKRVPAAKAQIIFSSLPLWSAIFAAMLLQGESMGTSGWGGGLLIVCAGIIASRR